MLPKLASPLYREDGDKDNLCAPEYLRRRDEDRKTTYDNLTMFIRRIRIQGKEPDFTSSILGWLWCTASTSQKFYVTLVMRHRKGRGTPQWMQENYEKDFWSQTPLLTHQGAPKNFWKSWRTPLLFPGIIAYYMASRYSWIKYFKDLQDFSKILPKLVTR